MLVWSLLLLFILFVRGTMGDLNTNSKKKIFLIIVGVATIVISGLRGDNYENVYDLSVYKQYYEIIAKTPWTNIFSISSFEPGFAVIVKILTYISAQGQFFIFFISLCTVGSMCYFIYDNTHQVFLAYYIFFAYGTFGFFLSGLRQGLAIAIFLYSVRFVKRGKFIPFLILALIAISVHFSAGVIIVAYLILRNEKIYTNPRYLILVVLLMIIFGDFIIEIGEKITTDTYSSGVAVYSLNGLTPIMIYSFIILISIFYGNKMYPIELPMTAIGLGLYFLRFYNMALERVAFYYTPASCIGLAETPFAFKKGESRRLFTLGMLVVGAILFYKRFSAADYGNYVFFWMV